MLEKSINALTCRKGKQLKKDHEIVVKIPRNESILKKILDEHIKDKKSLKEAPIKRLEDEINERVYKLYGLDEKNKKVINEFLERF